MKSLTNQEYLELCLKLVEQQYEDAVEDYDIEKMEWIPSETEIKKKKYPDCGNGMIDLTNTRSNKIKDEILKFTNLKVGYFTIRVRRYNGVPSQNGAVLSLDLEIYEEKHKTPNGQPCKIDYPAVLEDDDRFANRPWLKYFSGSSAHNVPIDTMIDIVRWMQAVKKLTVFL